MSSRCCHWDDTYFHVLEQLKNFQSFNILSGIFVYNVDLEEIIHVI